MEEERDGECELLLENSSETDSASLPRSRQHHAHPPLPGRSWWQVWRPVVGLCLTMAFIHCQPSEPYLTKYLRQDKNISEADLDSTVWPADTYAALVLLLPLGLAAEHFGCVPVILFGLCCRHVTRVLLLWGEGVGMMTLMQVTYAAATSSNAIIYAATYIAVEKKHYPRATAAVFSCGHVGNVVGSGIGELLVDVGKVQLKTLFYVSWMFTTFGTLAFVLLYAPAAPALAPAPAPAPRLTPTNRTLEIDSLTAIVLKGGGFRQLWKEMKVLYSSVRVRAWSAWWVFGYSQYYVIGNYYQNQFQNIDADAALGAAEIAIELSAVAGSMVPVLLSACFCFCCCSGGGGDGGGGGSDGGVGDGGAGGHHQPVLDCQINGGDNGAPIDAVAAVAVTPAVGRGRGRGRGGKSVIDIVAIACTTAAVGTVYLLSTKLQSSIYYSIFFNACGFGLNSAMFAYGSMVIAECISSPRHLLVFTANTFMALCLCSIVVSVGSLKGLSTDGYFVLAAGQEYAVALLATLSLLPFY